jgi:hypothetical protein
VIFDKVQVEGRERFVCIARKAQGRNGRFQEHFFRWPLELDALTRYVDEGVAGHNVYFAPMLFDGPTRTKEHCVSCPVVWADLDTCDPSNLLVPASVSIESSSGRWQALWIFNQEEDPGEVEDLARKIAYAHSEEGADKSGWDLTQLLRVPFTYNWKYEPASVVMIRSASSETTLRDMDGIYPSTESHEQSSWPFPEEIPNAQWVLEQHEAHMRPLVFRLIEDEPANDWSGALWNLEMLLCEEGLSREEVFAIASIAACNKYARDGRSQHALWAEVCKAWSTTHEQTGIIPSVEDVANLEDLLSDENMRSAEADHTFIDDYIDWGQAASDAAPEYHEAGAFVALSSILSGYLRLMTSIGPFRFNLWFMLLGDSTLTRKTTAMRLSTQMVMDVEKEIVLATDGSWEGLLTGISKRDGRATLYRSDEFSGTLATMTKREYMVGSTEMFTQLYDGSFVKRLLRKETITIDEPIFIFFVGGIRERVQSLLGPEHVTSGFVARFVLINGNVDMNRLRSIHASNAASEASEDQRIALVNRLRQMQELYRSNFTVSSNGNHAVVQNKPHVTLTQDAWDLYNSLEMKLIKAVYNTASQEMLLPTMDRLAKGGLKASVLIAASRMKSEHVTVEEGDVLKAFQYISKWRQNAIEVLANIGVSATERRIQQVERAIYRRRTGLSRSELMRNFHLNAFEAQLILDTLVQRGLIKRTPGRRGSISEMWFPTQDT